MMIAKATEKMIDFYKGNLHDIAHFLKVWSFAKTIGELEGLDSHTQEILELTAVIHDIACPLCRIKYGNTNGNNQEAESPALVEEFFKDFPLASEDLARISWLAAHHHTYTGVDGLDYQILLEADFLVNADESNFPISTIQSFREKVYKTKAGIRLLDSMYLSK